MSSIVATSFAGSYLWSCDAGHTNLVSMQLFHLDVNYNLHAIGKRIDVKKNHYYQDSGANKHYRNEAKWLKDFQPVLSQNLSQHSTKTTDIDQIISHVNILATIYSAYWEEVNKKRHRRMNFHCFIMKESFLVRQIARRCFHPYLNDGEVPLVIMGDASIPVSIRGTRTAPVLYIQSLFRRFCEVIPANEFRTTITCSWCGCIIHKVASHGARGYPIESRGLQFCGGLTCRLAQNPLHHRDHKRSHQEDI